MFEIANFNFGTAFVEYAMNINLTAKTVIIAELLRPCMVGFCPRGETVASFFYYFCVVAVK
jgi:hypothetical protein